MSDKFVIYCEHCEKKLMERREDGLFHFVFGAPRNDEGEIMGDAPIDMLIHGSIRMKCLRRTCRKVNILNFLPFDKDKKLS